jgi:hypothetical protein
MDIESKLAALIERVDRLEVAALRRDRARTWAELVNEIELIVADVQVKDLSDTLIRLNDVDHADRSAEVTREPDGQG